MVNAPIAAFQHQKDRHKKDAPIPRSSVKPAAGRRAMAVVDQLGRRVMKEPTMEEVLELVEFDRNSDGTLHIKKVFDHVWGDVQGDVKGDVWGDVQGSVWGNVYGHIWGDVNGTVNGKICGRKWQYVETPKERAIRLIREGKGEEAIKVLEEE